MPWSTCTTNLNTCFRGQLADEPDTTIEWRDVVLQKYGNDEQETLPLDITDAEAVAEVKPPPFWHCVSFPVLLVILRDSSLSFRQLDAKIFGQAAASVDVVVNCAVTRYSPVMSKSSAPPRSFAVVNMQKALESFGSVRSAL